LRLTLDIIRARLTKILGFARDARSIQFLDAAEILHHDSSHPVSHERIREVISSHSPAIWIGGTEPLRHPGVAHLVRAITGAVILSFSKLTERFFAGAFMSFSLCRGSF